MAGKKQSKRDKALYVKLTEAEHGQLAGLSKVLGCNRSVIIRDIIARECAKYGVPQEMPEEPEDDRQVEMFANICGACG